jgi:hypothetical protein
MNINYCSYSYDNNEEKRFYQLIRIQCSNNKNIFTRRKYYFETNVNKKGTI